MTPLASAFEKFVFRRVHAPRTENTKISGYNVFCTEGAVTGDDKFEHYDAGKLPEKYVNKTDYDRRVEVYATRFHTVTLPTKIRDNDRYHGTPIFVHSSNGGALNPLTLEFLPDNYATSEVGATGVVVPRQNDLVCGIVEKTPKGLQYSKWFICSEQFLRLMTLIVYGEDHPSFMAIRDMTVVDATQTDTPVVDVSDATPTQTKELESVRRALMRGNRLMIGCAVYKEILCRSHNFKTSPDGDGAVPMTYDELLSKYSRSRCELATRQADCVHLYAAIATIAYYKESLTKDNIPNNIRGEYFLKEWVVPYGAAAFEAGFKAQWGM